MKSKTSESTEQKSSTYYLKSIPAHIQTQLQVAFATDRLKSIKGSDLTMRWKEMNEQIFGIYKGDKDKYQKYFRLAADRDYHFFSRKSLERYFDSQPIRSDMMYAILTFLGYDPSQFDKAMKGVGTDNHSNTSFISGFWKVYVHDSGTGGPSKVEQSLIFFKEKNAEEGTFTIRYKSVWSLDFNGSATIINDSLILNLSDNNNTRLFIILYMPDKKDILNSETFILSGSCLSNGHKNQIVTADMIFVKEKMAAQFESDKEVQEHFRRNEVQNLDFGGAERNEQQVMRFLSRSGHKDRTIRPFSPQTFESITARNAEYDRRNGTSNYEKLKLKIKQEDCFYLSFNRHRPGDEIAFYEYSFFCNDSERMVMVKRHPVGDKAIKEYVGYAYLESEKVYFVMKDYNLQRSKQFIAPISSSHSGTESNKSEANDLRYFILKGITSSVTTIGSAHMALREIIICLKKAGKESFLESLQSEAITKGYINYEMFSGLDNRILHPKEMLYLSSRFLSVLSYPSENDPASLYTRLDKARRYSNTYFLFIKHTADTLLKWALVIDDLSQVTLKMNYGEDGSVDEYNGYCEFFNHNLHITTQFLGSHPAEQKCADIICDFIREIRGEKTNVLTGSLLSTDEKNDSVAYRFVAITAELHRQPKRTDGANTNATAELGVTQFVQFEEYYQGTLPARDWQKVSDCISKVMN